MPIICLFVLFYFSSKINADLLLLFQFCVFFCFLRINLEQETREIGVAELEVPLVVELEKGGTVGVVLLQVQVVQLGFGGGVTTVLANIHLKMKT